MNQTKKRLSIINLAISITDIETIQLQMLKLGLLRSDSKIQEIITMLQAENYAQAQGLITTYIETPTEEILQRSAQEDDNSHSEQEIIEEFDLFIEKEEKESDTVVPLEEIDDISTFIDPLAKEMGHSTEQINYDALLNMEANEVLPDNIELDISSSSTKDTFFDAQTHQSIDDVFSQKSNDTFFESIEEDTFLNESKEKIFIEEERIDLLSTPIEETVEEVHAAPVPEIKSTPLQYKAVSYIKEKFQNRLKQYPPIERSENEFTSVSTLLETISHKGYSEEEVEETIAHIDKLSIDNKAEAAELLLIIGSTESKYAQFRLARALFKGDILHKNVPEAFTLINRLAVNDDYPEAICDLGQFYEYGIGIDRDITKARLLYKEAMELGIKRATEHYERTASEERGLFSFLKK